MLEQNWRVKRFCIYVCLIFVFDVLAGCSLAPDTTKPNANLKNGQSLDSRPIMLPELIFKVPEPERIELTNGMIVYLFEDHLLPVVSVYASIRAGQIYEPVEKAGLAALTGAVMRSGGTKTVRARELDEKLEFIAAHCTTDIGRDMATASLTARTENLDEAFGIFADILRNPAFEETRIELEKQKVIERFRREDDEPYDVVSREFRKIVYGDHPYSRRIEGYPGAIEKITRADLSAFHSRYFQPNNIILGVAGDFSRDDMLAKLTKYFGDWQKTQTDYPAVPNIEYKPTRHLAFFQKELQQATFYIGHIGVDRLNQDFFSIEVMNFILGEDFTSRLNENVRTKAGLAYAVGSYMDYYKYSGTFISYCSTKTESSYDAVQRILGEFKRIRDEEVSDEEFERAKASLCNKFVFKFETSEDIISLYVDYEYKGLPKDYLKNYLANIKKVTKQDVQNAAKKYVHPDEAVILILGSEECLKTFPTDFGQFERIESNDK
jgi:zinc protease